MTGRSDFWRSRRSSSMPSMRGILMSKIARFGGRASQPLKRRGAVSIGLDAIAFGFEGDRDRCQNVAVVIDKRDCLHVSGLPHVRMSLPCRDAYLGTNWVQIVA